MLSLASSPPRSMVESPPRPMSQLNLESFLYSVTPVVPSMNLQIGEENIEYFMLGDLWRSYEEWSAYGVGISVMLNNNTDKETIVQYYTPYLSAIQLYKHRKRRGSAKLSSNHVCETRGQDPITYPYFQYNETISPFNRVPLKNKIEEFVGTFPGLVSLKSIDLSPASWMSIAWVPIYHIPSNEKKVQDLSTHFLTFHTLSSHFQGDNIVAEKTHSPHEREEFVKANNKRISLSPFGLSTLKMQGDVWINHEDDYEKLIDLHRAADSWLKQLKVNHSDFDYYNQKNLEAGGIFK